MNSLRLRILLPLALFGFLPAIGAVRLMGHSLEWFFGLEGLLLFVILALYSRKPRPVGSIGGLFLVGYGCARFVVEYAREPDSHLGLLAFGWSMGQWLSMPMIVIGLGLIVLAYKQQNKQ